MELYLARHAMAVSPGQIARDSERPLSDDGRKRMVQATKAWDGLGVTVDGILTSPYLHARQTAEIAAEALGIPDRVEALRVLGSGASPGDVIDALRERCGENHRVMLVGHEPDLGRLASVLLCGDDQAGIRIKKGGLTKLVVDGLHRGRCAVLEWHLWPRHLVRMS